MQKIRILAVIDLILIALSFVFMVVMLFLGKNAGFYVGGTLLSVFLILGFLLKAARKRHEEREKEAEEQETGNDEEESLADKAKVRSDL